MPNDLLSLIREKQAAIATLQAELNEAKRLLLGDVDAGQAATQPKADGPARVVHMAAGSGKTSTLLAVQVLQAAGRPMHVGELIAAIKQQYGEDVKRDTVVGNLSRLIKAKKTFVRTGPNVFGIRGRDEEEQLPLAR